MLDKEWIWPCQHTLINSYENNELVSCVVNIQSRVASKDFTSDAEIYNYKFQVGETDWMLRLYPHGFGEKNKKFVSVFFRMKKINSHSFPLKVKYKFNYNDFNEMLEEGTFEKEETGLGWCRWKPKDEEFYDLDCVVKFIGRKNAKPYSTVCVPYNIQNVCSDHTIIEIKANGGSFRAHRDILMNQRSVFKVMLSSDMKESNENSIEMVDYDYQTIGTLLDFMYTGRLNIKNDNLGPLIELSEMYDLKLLKLCCDQQLSLFVNCDNVCHSLVLSEEYKLSFTKRICLDFIKINFKDVVETPGWEFLIFNHGKIVLYLSKEMKTMFNAENNI